MAWEKNQKTTNNCAQKKQKQFDEHRKRQIAMKQR